MKLARILLASAAVALLAACSSDPVGPSATPERIKPRHSITADTTAVNTDVITNGGILEITSGCVDTTVVVAGVTTIVRVCDGRGPALGSGGN